MTSHQKEYIASYVNAVEGILYSENFTDPVAGYQAYIDVNSFIDYFIISEISRNVDGYKKSRFFYKDKDSKNPKVHSGPVWDYDWAWKNLNDCFLYRNTDGSGWAYCITARSLYGESFTRKRTKLYSENCKELML